MMSGSRTSSDASVARTTRTTRSTAVIVGQGPHQLDCFRDPVLGRSRPWPPPASTPGPCPPHPRPCCSQFSFFANIAILRLPSPFRLFGEILTLAGIAAPGPNCRMLVPQQSHEDPRHRRGRHPRQGSSNRAAGAAKAPLGARLDAASYGAVGQRLSSPGGATRSSRSAFRPASGAGRSPPSPPTWDAAGWRSTSRAPSTARPR